MEGGLASAICCDQGLDTKENSYGKALQLCRFGMLASDGDQLHEHARLWLSCKNCKCLQVMWGIRDCAAHKRRSCFVRPRLPQCLACLPHLTSLTSHWQLLHTTRLARDVECILILLFSACQGLRSSQNQDPIPDLVWSHISPAPLPYLCCSSWFGYSFFHYATASFFGLSPCALRVPLFTIVA